ncbi:MAG: hypothetical protein ACRCVY_05365 [Commensalibacter sp.]|nr:hypothetical protein [Commensalibacter sp.]
MAALITLMICCIVLLIMFAVVCALWDAITGRWSKKQQIQELQNDTDLFGH